MSSRYLSNPGMEHWKAAKRVIRYLKRTKDYILIYKRSDQLEIIGYSDSNFVGCQDSRKSTSGYIYLLVGGAISWKSAKQTLIVSSTMAVEFIAYYEAYNHGIWLRIHLLRDYHLRPFMSTPLIWVLYLFRMYCFSGSLYFRSLSVV